MLWACSGVGMVRREFGIVLREKPECVLAYSTCGMHADQFWAIIKVLCPSNNFRLK
jgi:hypothetical protein